MACLILLMGITQLCENPEAVLANRSGLEKSEAQDFFGGAREFRTAHRIDPGCPVIQINLVIACLNSGNLEEAGAHLEALGGFLPGDPYVIYLSGVLKVRLGRDAEARQHFQRLLEIDRSDSTTLSQLGLIESHAGNHARDGELFRKALEIDPDDTVALYNQARLCILEGDREGGERLIDRFRKVKRRPTDRPMGGMGEPVLVPGKYARFRGLEGPKDGS